MTQTPIALRRPMGAEWQKHIAGRALAERAARQARDAVWREVEPFIPC